MSERALVRTQCFNVKVVTSFIGSFISRPMRFFFLPWFFFFLFPLRAPAAAEAPTDRRRDSQGSVARTWNPAFSTSVYIRAPTDEVEFPARGSERRSCCWNQLCVTPRAEIMRGTPMATSRMAHPDDERDDDSRWLWSSTRAYSVSSWEQ